MASRRAGAPAASVALRRVGARGARRGRERGQGRRAEQGRKGSVEVLHAGSPLFRVRRAAGERPGRGVGMDLIASSAP